MCVYVCVCVCVCVYACAFACAYARVLAYLVQQERAGHVAHLLVLVPVCVVQEAEYEHGEVSTGKSLQTIRASTQELTPPTTHLVRGIRSAACLCPNSMS